MVKILVSRCFLGERCKWNGRSNENEEVKKLLDVVEFVPICPEVDSGLPTPRIPSEIVSPDKVENEVGLDVTEYFKNGAKIALKTDFCSRHWFLVITFSPLFSSNSCQSAT
jgi:uncharacterized protein YbbK (DUF523 family)